MDTNRISNAAKKKGWSRRQRGYLMIGIQWLRFAMSPKYRPEHWRSYRVMLHGGGLNWLRYTRLNRLLIGADAAAPEQIFTEIEKYLGLQ